MRRGAPKSDDVSLSVITLRSGWSVSSASSTCDHQKVGVFCFLIVYFKAVLLGFVSFCWDVYMKDLSSCIICIIHIWSSIRVFWFFVVYFKAVLLVFVSFLLRWLQMIEDWFAIIGFTWIYDLVSSASSTCDHPKLKFSMFFLCIFKLFCWFLWDDWKDFAIRLHLKRFCTIFVFIFLSTQKSLKGHPVSRV